jgi:glycogen operon protein
MKSQKGNNNCYCQDNELSWFDWNLVQENADMLRFVREMISFRNRHPCLSKKHFLTGRKKNIRGVADIVWHGIEPGTFPWDDPESKFIAFTMGGTGEEEPDIHVIINMEEKAVDVMLPDDKIFSWHLAVDTMRASPDDIAAPEDQQPFRRGKYTAGPRSVVVFESR